VRLRQKCTFSGIRLVQNSDFMTEIRKKKSAEGVRKKKKTRLYVSVLICKRVSKTSSAPTAKMHFFGELNRVRALTSRLKYERKNLPKAYVKGRK
jgi:hypothetical protein